MNKLTAIIETAQDNYSAYVEGIDGVVATGSTLDEIKLNLAEALEDYVITCRELGCEVPKEIVEDYGIEFKMDVKSLLELYSEVFTKAGLERITGINQKQLWHYAKGRSVPRKAQTLKIEGALHKLGSELMSIHL